MKPSANQEANRSKSGKETILVDQGDRQQLKQLINLHLLRILKVTMKKTINWQ